MSLFPDLRTFITIGPLSIKWYAVFILSGAFISYVVSSRAIKKMGHPVSVLDDLYFGAIVAGIIGSRLWYVLFYDLQTYLSNPLSIFMTWNGGLAIQGGLLLGALYAYVYLKRKHISFLRMADAIVPTILIAQAMGRWGNFMNQEAYGKIVPESFYALWPNFIKNVMLIGGEFREPTFFYESSLNLLGFFLIWFGLKKFSENRRGDLMYAYLMWYGLIRFWVEGLRTDSLMFMGLRTAQMVSIAFLLIGVLGRLGLFRRFTKPKKPLIIFDLDGTLLDTEPLIIESFDHVLKTYRPDLTITREMELSFLGPTLSENLHKYLPSEKVNEAIELYRKHNRDIHPKKLKEIPNATKLLTQLKEEGYALGIFSSKKKDMVEYGLSLVGWESYFEAIIGYDEVTQHKPHPEGLLKTIQAMKGSVDAAIYVGDTYTDIQAAHACGVYSVAYLSHPERKDAILNEVPNARISDLTELMDVLKGDHEWTHDLT